MKSILSSVFLGLIAVPVIAQPVFFESVWGGSGNDFSRAVRQLSDGSIYVAGNSNSGTLGGNDFVLCKLNRYGSLLWTKYYGDTLENYGLNMNTTADGNFILCGETQTASNGLDIYFYKVDTSGTVLWSKIYGTTANESAAQTLQVSDGGYLLTGFHSDSFASNNSYILKVSSSGNFIWERSLGGTDNDVGMECHETPEGDLVFTGDTKSFGAGGYDIQITKLDKNGNIKWNYYSGDSLQNGCQGLLLASDNRYLSFGESETFPSSPYDFWVELLDSSGSSQWKKKIGGTNADAAFSALETADGGFIFTGYSNSYSPGPIDVIIFKTDSSGNLLWTKNYGNAGIDIGYEIIPSVYGGFLITGKYFDNNEQFYLLHVDSAGVISGLTEEEGSFAREPAFPNPVRGAVRMKITASSGEALYVFDGSGKKINIPADRIPGGYLLQCENTLPGLYFYTLVLADGRTRSGKFVVQ